MTTDHYIKIDMQKGIRGDTQLKKRMQVFIIPLLILLAAGVYLNTLANDFVAGDRQFILRNEHIGDFGTVLNSFTSDYWAKLGGESFMYYRPLVIFTHFLDFKLYGLNPAGHHLSNIIFHCIATLSVYLLFLTILPAKRWIACAGSALFALHPVHTHSVSYIMGRTDILATLFFIWSLILLARMNRPHIGHSKMTMLLLACTCFLFALLCKEIAVTLPLVFVLIYRCCDTERFSWKNSNLLIPLLFLIMTALLYLVMRIAAVGMSSQLPSLPWYSLLQKIWLVFKTLGFYLVKLLFPVQLCYYSNIVVPGCWSEVFTSPLIWVSVLYLAAIAVALKHSPDVGCALCWIMVTLLPVLNIYMLPALAKENYLYLPSIGFCLFLAIICDKGMKSPVIRYASNAMLIGSAALVIAVLYAAGTINRNHDYKSPLSFLESTIKTMAPVASIDREDPRFFEPVKNFFITYKNLGIIYQAAGQTDKAFYAFGSALEFTPLYFSAAYNASVKVLLGVLLDQNGKHKEALTMLQEARPFAENPAAVDNRMGMVCSRLGNEREAELYFKRAIQEDGRYAPAHYNLGIMYIKSAANEKGIEELGIATRLNPKYASALTRYGNRSVHRD